MTAPAGAAPGAGLPVLVWLHGGGFRGGSGSDYDPRRMVADGRVVVVTVNYRLGALGFLSWPGLPGEGAFGLLDLRLRVRRPARRRFALHRAAVAVHHHRGAARLGPQEEALATAMRGFWTAFATTGDPGAGWPGFGAAGPVLTLATSGVRPVGAAEFAAAHHCDVWS